MINDMTPSTLHPIYTQLSTLELLALRRAFDVEVRPTVLVDLQAFCQRRVGLIDAILADRRVLSQFE